MCFIGLRLKINLYTIFPAIGVPGGEPCHFVIRTDNPSLPFVGFRVGPSVVCESMYSVFVLWCFAVR